MEELCAIKLCGVLDHLFFQNSRAHTGTEIRWSDTEDAAGSPLTVFWKHSDAILCCSLKVGRRCASHAVDSRPHDSMASLPSNCSLRHNLRPGIVYCSQPAFTLKFTNSAGFDILETTVANVQDLQLEAVLDDGGQKALVAQLPKIMLQVPLLTLPART